tara:strand:+ start:817 stop:1167 length:351 start_codon:yes stop_codon:yes gene_type:complete
MASGRYDNRVIRFNRSDIYEDLRRKRGVKQLKQYLTQQLGKLSPEDRSEITTIQHVWKTGDRFYKLAHQYYNFSEYWWVIAWYNQKPTENHINIGDVIFIPFPPDLLASLYSKPTR